MKRVLPLLLLATLALLVVVPQVVQARHGSHEFNHDQDTDDEDLQLHVLASFNVKLTGEQQVPEVDTEAFGFASVRLFDNMTIGFRVVVCDIFSVTHSHIHFNATGTNGPIIIHFFDQPDNPVSSTEGCLTLAHGTRGVSDLIPSTAAGIKTWDDFVQALLAGNTYVNVHTTAHPGGEIRGQLTTENENEQGDD